MVDQKLQVNAQLMIAGKDYNFVSLSLEQSFGEHHHFSIHLDYDALSNKSFMDNPLDQVDLISEKVLIKFTQGTDTANAYTFIGVVTDVEMIGHDGKHGYIRVSGSSPTIMLERGKRLEVYTNMSQRRICDILMEDLPQGYLNVSNAPIFNGPLDFLMQYNENDWQFLQRLSAIFGETLFFDGRKLVYGKMDDEKTAELMYDREITSFKLCSKLLPNHFQNFYYLPEHHDTVKKTAKDSIPRSSDMVKMAAVKSFDLKTKYPIKTPSDAPVGDPGQIEELVLRKKVRTAGESVRLIAQGKTCDPRIGQLVCIDLPPSMSKSESIGTYRVIKIVHTIDQNHRYHNEFEAMPCSLEFMPTPALVVPHANSLLATVKDNADPLKQGRVQIEFDFTNQHCQAWLRVMTPDAGSSDKVSKNRGMVFIPEKGDQVMVNFEMGDPNRPYVMGSFHHKGNGQGGGDGNNLRGIVDKANNFIQMHATDGLKLKDKDGSDSQIHLDGNKNIGIQAGKSITTNINKGQSIFKMDSEGNATIEVTSQLELKVGTSVITITQKEISITSAANTITGTNHITGGNTIIDGGSIVTIEGGQVDIN